MNHQWERQSAGDVRCIVCGARALAPNDKSCVGESARADMAATKKAKPCCGEKTGASATGPVTRPSCLECVEKHLGAAWVLLAEARDGYPHRLRAIGHLHEAEDESQQWLALHDAIRESRKAYQRDGSMPDFDVLAGLVDRMHGDSVYHAGKTDMN